MTKNTTKKLFENPKLYMKFWKSQLSDRRTAAEVSFLRKSMKINKWDALLDAPCGFWRHSLYFAKMWCKVTWIDNNKYFIQQAKKSRKWLKAQFLEEDMLSLKYTEQFDHICNIFSSFGYFSDKNNIKLLNIFHKALKTGGKLCIDVVNRDRILSSYENGKVRKNHTILDNDVMLDAETFDPLTWCLQNNKKFVTKGKIIDAGYSMRLYTYTELKDMLERCGFNVLYTYGNYDSSTYTQDSNRIIIIAQKE